MVHIIHYDILTNYVRGKKTSCSSDSPCSAIFRNGMLLQYINKAYRPNPNLLSCTTATYIFLNNANLDLIITLHAQQNWTCDLTICCISKCYTKLYKLWDVALVLHRHLYLPTLTQIHFCHYAKSFCACWLNSWLVSQSIYRQGTDIFYSWK